MSFRIEKATFALRPRKGDFKTHQTTRLAQETAWLLAQLTKHNTSPFLFSFFLFNFFFSLSLSLSWRCLYLVAKLEGVAITSTPHLPSFSHKNKFKKTTKNNWPSFYLPSSPMFSFLSLLVSCRFQRACVQIT